MMVIGANDFFGGVLVRIGREELHDQSGNDESEHYAGHDGPMVTKVIVQDRRPQLVQDNQGDGGGGEAGD